MYNIWYTDGTQKKVKYTIQASQEDGIDDEKEQ